MFLVGQITGWLALFSTGYNFTHKSAAYLYVISGIHALHILGGLIFLGAFIVKSWRMLNNYAMSVVYFTDPISKSQLTLFGTFWHFLGVQVGMHKAQYSYAWGENYERNFGMGFGARSARTSTTTCPSCPKR